MADKKMPRYPQQHEPWRPHDSVIPRPEAGQFLTGMRIAAAYETTEAIHRMLASARTDK